VRLAVSLNSVPRQFKLSPILARIVKVNHEMSKDKIVAAITRYIDRRQLRDPRDGRVATCVVSRECEKLMPTKPSLSKLIEPERVVDNFV
jgi:chromatin remodeling complex protein RSC6